MPPAYVSPPLNTGRTAWSLRRVSVEFAWSFCYKSGGKPKECRVASETLIRFPPFRLEVLNAQLWRDNELVTIRPKPLRFWPTGRHLGVLSHGRGTVPRRLSVALS